MPLNRLWNEAAKTGQKPLEPDATYKKILIEGKPKTGKTTFGSTCPKPFYLDTDGGLATLVGTKYKYLSVNREMLDGLGGAVISLLNDAIHAKGHFAPDGIYGDRETFVIDSIHKLAQWVKEETMLYIVKPARDPLTQKPGYDHWAIIGNTLAQIGDLICLLAQTRMNVVGLIGVKDITVEVVNEKGKNEMKKVGTGPNLEGKIKSIIGHWWDEVWVLDKTKRGLTIKYSAYTGVYKDFEGLGSRSSLPTEVENPSYAKVCAALNAKAGLKPMSKVTPKPMSKTTSKVTPKTPVKRKLKMKSK